MSNESELIDITCKLHAQTEKAILVSDDDDEDHAEWLPKSQIDFIERGLGIVEITLPEWLAVKKGLV